MPEEQQNPRSTKLALDSLGGHPAWPIYCARFDEIVRKEIDAKVFNTTTTDEERRVLVNARRLLMETYAPEKMRESMLVSVQTQLQRENSR